MQIEQPNCHDLEPMLEHTYVDDRAAWSVFVRFLPVVKRAAGRGWMSRDAHRLGMGDSTELATEAMIRLTDKIRRSCGLARPPDCEDRSPGAWFYTVVHNEALSVHRAARAASRRALGEAQSTTTPENRDILDRHQVGDDGQPEEVIDLRRRFRRQLARFESADVPPAQRLVWACQFAPHLVTLPLVESAVNWSYNEGSGAVRNATETHVLLGRWMDERGERPTTVEAKLHLAWILQSSDQTSPETWRRNDRDVAAKARDTLRQWLNRARERLDEEE